jgi:hypothetical protein
VGNELKGRAMTVARSIAGTSGTSGWAAVEVLARLLARHDREAVLGDLAEGEESAWRGVVDVIGLVVRRQAELWRSWRPWVAAFGLALPFSFLLMGFSLSVSGRYQRLLTLSQPSGMSAGAELGLLVCQLVLLAGWSWSGGFVVGALSRRTLWVSVAATFAPCLFCLSRFRNASLSRVCLLLFLVPAICGLWRALRVGRIGRSAALVVAAGVTLAMACMWLSVGVWVANWCLVWPVWYLVAIARRRSEVA